MMQPNPTIESRIPSHLPYPRCCVRDLSRNTCQKKLRGDPQFEISGKWNGERRSCGSLFLLSKLLGFAHSLRLSGLQSRLFQKTCVPGAEPTTREADVYCRGYGTCFRDWPW